ncbi:GNAT family N-acetyltransferase [Peribacillus sp. SCS-37]|uniref:GNAT family N-acetyltransferase n=1 Tax=Paraperibacillus esterisolvens TaxID=3115296 RepID=UPI0039061C12
MAAYYHSFYVFDKTGQSRKAVIRNYKEEDFPELIAIQKECFPPPFPQELLWNREQLLNHVSLYPEGALFMEVDGEAAGSMTALLVNHDPNKDHTWSDITDDGYIRTHNPDGNSLYIVDISIRPSFRKFGLGKCLMQSMYQIVTAHGLDRLIGGGRMPGYHKHAERLSPAEYLEEVCRGNLKDPVISFLLRCGRSPVKVIANYLDDEESLHHAALMEWKNPFKSDETPS